MIYPYQTPVHEELRRSCAVHAMITGESPEIRPRTHRLIAGPTGTGKTWLAQHVAEELGWAHFHISAPGWVPMGAKGPPTWPDLAYWVAENPKKNLMVILDEVDKVGTGDSWANYIRLELHDLLDGRMPGGEYEFPEGVDGEEVAKRIKQVMVVGCGAWQGLHDRGPTVGFNSAPHPVSTDSMADVIPREIVNRFRLPVLHLPKLSRSDYEDLADGVRRVVSPHDHAWLDSVLPDAYAAAEVEHPGARFAEALVAQWYDHRARIEEYWNTPVIDLTQIEM